MASTKANTSTKNIKQQSRNNIITPSRSQTPNTLMKPTYASSIKKRDKSQLHLDQEKRVIEIINDHQKKIGSPKRITNRSRVNILVKSDSASCTPFAVYNQKSIQSKVVKELIYKNEDVP